MKKTITTMIALFVLSAVGFTQSALNELVAKLDKATKVQQYEQLANQFLEVANSQKKAWLPYYYAAYCNARIGWDIKEDEPGNIEKYADKADKLIKQAKALIDTATQKKEMSEIYCVQSMLNRAMVYINFVTYGKKYGIAAMQYTQLARSSNPNNPRALFIEGWEKYATPKLYGGDKKKAKELLLDAQNKLSSEAAGVQPHWGKKDVNDLLKKLK